MNSDLEHLRQKQVDQETENMNLASQSQEMMSINMQLQSTVMKAQAKQIDLELRKLDATQANDRLSYIQVCMSGSFPFAHVLMIMLLALSTWCIPENREWSYFMSFVVQTFGIQVWIDHQASWSNTSYQWEDHG